MKTGSWEKPRFDHTKDPLHEAIGISDERSSQLLSLLHDTFCPIHAKVEGSITKRVEWAYEKFAPKTNEEQIAFWFYSGITLGEIMAQQEEKLEKLKALDKLVSSLAEGLKVPPFTKEKTMN